MTDNAERIVRNCYNTAMSFLSELQKPQNTKIRKSRAVETESRDMAHRSLFLLLCPPRLHHFVAFVVY